MQHGLWIIHGLSFNNARCLTLRRERDGAVCESTLQPDSCQLKPQEGAAKMGKVSSVSAITLKDVVTVFSSVLMCVKRLGVHAPLSSQMVFASDAVFSINLQSFFTHITYCKASARAHTHTLPVGSCSAP